MNNPVQTPSDIVSKLGQLLPVAAILVTTGIAWATVQSSVSSNTRATDDNAAALSKHETLLPVMQEKIANLEKNDINMRIDIDARGNRRDILSREMELHLTNTDRAVGALASQLDRTLDRVERLEDLLKARSATR